jgi:membrane associated rhomboid family serine protease
MHVYSPPEKETKMLKSVMVPTAAAAAASGGSTFPPKPKQRPPDIETGEHQQHTNKNPLLGVPEPDQEREIPPEYENALTAAPTWGTWGQDWYSPTPGNPNGTQTANVNAGAGANIRDMEGQGPNPPRKILYPNPNAQVPSNASHLTDSGAEDNGDHHGNVYHLANHDKASIAEIQYNGDVAKPSKRHRENLKKWYEKNDVPVKLVKPPKMPRSKTVPTSPIRSSSESDDDSTRFRSLDTNTEDGTLAGNADGVWSEDDYWKTKQGTAYLSITLTSLQLLVLMMQLAMCGVANLDVNPMIGPFPDAFSEWGGKNAYLMLTMNQWWRILTPAFLHVGVLHLFANAFCQLETVALFEREWGSLRWATIYLLSAAGGTLYSSVFDPDTIAVGSSGALMGMYAAKLSQVMSHTFFDVNKTQENDVIRLDQLSGVLCGLTLVSLLSSFTYIDWSGHMGGLVTGLFAGMILFCRPIANCCSRFVWGAVGVLGLVSTLVGVVYVLVTNTEPNQDLSDACNYFRNLFPENYECGCLWQ